MELLLDAVDLLDYVQNRSLRVSVNTLDFTLIDPPSIPVLGDTAEVDDPAWAGTIASVEVKDYRDTLFIKVTAKNTDDPAAAPAPHGLSDDPDEATTYAYKNLSITYTLHNAVEERRGTLTTYEPGLIPGHVFELTSANHGFTAEEFSIVEVSVRWLNETTPEFDVTFGEPIVTLSAWVAENPGVIFPITETRITDGSITTPKLAANAVTAAKLEAILILTSLLKTAESGNRIEIDANGIRSYDDDDVLVLNLPNDGSPNYLKAQLLASELIVTGDAELRGAGNELALGSVTSLAYSQTDPQQAPVLLQTNKEISLPIDADFDVSSTTYRRFYLDYDAAGSTGGATKVFWQVSRWTGEYYLLLELLASDRTVNRGVLLAGTPLGIARHGSYVYVLYLDTDFAYKVRRHLASNLSIDTTYLSVDFPVSPPINGRICSNGTNLYIVAQAGSGSEIKWNKYDADMVKVGSTISTGYSPNNVPLDAAAGNFDLGAFRLAISTTEGYVELFNSTGTRQANEQFRAYGWGIGGITYGDALADGARFWVSPYMSSPLWAQPLLKLSTWTWTTESAIYWVAYSWYDSVATVHETLVGPLASVTLDRRAYLNVTVAPIPGGGGANDPDNHRVYMTRNATEPATTALDLQATMDEDTVELSTYDSGGAAPPATNDFPAGTAAELKSQTAGWSLKGDGTATFSLPTTWIAPSLSNSWVNFGSVYETAGYRKDSVGVVHLRGLVKSGSSAGAVITTLPAGYRPAQRILVMSVANDLITRLAIDTNGDVYAEAGGSTTWTSIHVSFYVGF